MLTVAFPELDAEQTTAQDIDAPYDVVLHNDEVNTFEYVIACLIKVLEIDARKAAGYALSAHEEGRCVVWSGARAEAALRARKLQAMSLTVTCRKIA